MKTGFPLKGSGPNNFIARFWFLCKYSKIEQVYNKSTDLTEAMSNDSNKYKLLIDTQFI